MSSERRCLVIERYLSGWNKTILIYRFPPVYCGSVETLIIIFIQIVKIYFTEVEKVIVYSLKLGDGLTKVFSVTVSLGLVHRFINRNKVVITISGSY